MKVVQILNHNAVTVRGRSGEIVIAVGKGIGFGKHKGDLVQLKAVTNFYCEDKQYSLLQNERAYYWEVANSMALESKGHSFSS